MINKIISEGTGADENTLAYLDKSYNHGVRDAIEICRKEIDEDPSNADRTTAIRLIMAQLHSLLK